jgi:hypothetical protein
MKKLTSMVFKSILNQNIRSQLLQEVDRISIDLDFPQMRIHSDKGGREFWIFF